jgi:hypothetical protein
VPYEDFSSAMDLAISGDCGKVVLDF